MENCYVGTPGYCICAVATEFPRKAVNDSFLRQTLYDELVIALNVGSFDFAKVLKFYLENLPEWVGSMHRVVQFDSGGLGTFYYFERQFIRFFHRHSLFLRFLGVLPDGNQSERQHKESRPFDASFNILPKIMLLLGFVSYWLGCWRRRFRDGWDWIFWLTMGFIFTVSGAFYVF